MTTTELKIRQNGWFVLISNFLSLIVGTIIINIVSGQLSHEPTANKANIIESRCGGDSFSYELSGIDTAYCFKDSDCIHEISIKNNSTINFQSITETLVSKNNVYLLIGKKKHYLSEKIPTSLDDSIFVNLKNLSGPLNISLVREVEGTECPVDEGLNMKLSVTQEEFLLNIRCIFTGTKESGFSCNNIKDYIPENENKFKTSYSENKWQGKAYALCKEGLKPKKGQLDYFVNSVKESYTHITEVELIFGNLDFLDKITLLSDCSPKTKESPNGKGNCGINTQSFSSLKESGSHLLNKNIIRNRLLPENDFSCAIIIPNNKDERKEEDA